MLVMGLTEGFAWTLFSLLHVAFAVGNSAEAPRYAAMSFAIPAMPK